ncbi:hypothetical protein SAMN07250955_11937 [Arboricoccus pini]|uniref:Uncharacterized protein n=1 Tax=Arboricoccus pini TaxID=1963835 RepID=A0A212S191_9PROT|nr:hypothetical protein SAMN07250955_11937 [Arboricoccus pini]
MSSQAQLIGAATARQLPGPRQKALRSIAGLAVIVIIAGIPCKRVRWPGLDHEACQVPLPVGHGLVVNRHFPRSV